jgi:hypothetical protein
MFQFSGTSRYVSVFVSHEWVHVLPKNMKGRDHLEDLGVVGWAILK